MSFSRQIVYGLGYLSFKAYVHRDLAARNVLVAEDGTCKVCVCLLVQLLMHIILHLHMTIFPNNQCTIASRYYYSIVIQ